MVNSTSVKELSSLDGQGRVKVRTSFVRRVMAQRVTLAAALCACLVTQSVFGQLRVTG